MSYVIGTNEMLTIAFSCSLWRFTWWCLFSCRRTFCLFACLKEIENSKYHHWNFNYLLSYLFYRIIYLDDHFSICTKKNTTMAVIFSIIPHGFNSSIILKLSYRWRTVIEKITETLFCSKCRWYTQKILTSFFRWHSSKMRN